MEKNEEEAKYCVYEYFRIPIETMEWETNIGSSTVVQ